MAKVTTHRTAQILTQSNNSDNELTQTIFPTETLNLLLLPCGHGPLVVGGFSGWSREHCPTVGRCAAPCACCAETPPLVLLFKPGRNGDDDDDAADSDSLMLALTGRLSRLSSRDTCLLWTPPSFQGITLIQRWFSLALWGGSRVEYLVCHIGGLLICDTRWCPLTALSPQSDAIIIEVGTRG